MWAFTRRNIRLPGQEGEIALLDIGDPSRPVDAVFAHANGFNALTYIEALGPLGADLRIIAPDLRGHGRTTLAADPTTREDWMDLSRDLVALMQALAIDHPIVLSGHSMGGRAALMTTLVAPDRVKGLVLFDPVMFRRPPDAPARGPSGPGNALAAGALRRRSRFDSREAAIESWRGRGAFATWPETALQAYATDALTPDGEGVRLACSPEWEASGYLTSGNGPYALPVLYGIDKPTLVLKGERGSTCDPGPGDPEAGANPNLKIRVIECTTHFLPMERPELVQAGLREIRTWSAFR